MLASKGHESDFSEVVETERSQYVDMRLISGKKNGIKHLIGLGDCSRYTKCCRETAVPGWLPDHGSLKILTLLRSQLSWLTWSFLKLVQFSKILRSDYYFF